MIRIKGIGTGGGIAVGRVHQLDRRRVKVLHRHLAPDEVEAEVERFVNAVETTVQQLDRIKRKLESINQGTLILEAHQLIVGDPNLSERTLHHIRHDRANAEWALREATREIRRAFDQVDDKYFHERRSDIDFGVRHLLVTLTGDTNGQERVEAGAVVVAHELSPADVARLHRDGAVAVVTEVGGKTSHTVIMARSLGMPAVVGVPGATSRIGVGDEVIVDGDRGDVVASPDARTRAERKQEGDRRAAVARRQQDLAKGPLRTEDGVEVGVFANVGLAEEIASAVSLGVDGIGLYRTEFLYLDRQTLPTEDEHQAHARRVMMAAGALPVTFRTCDLGPGKLPLEEKTGREPNPAMGLRALRLAARRPELLHTQLRGLFRGAAERPVRVMFPLVSGVAEFRAAKATALRVAAELSSPPSKVELGALIELPAAALQARALAAEVDFLAVGTNDLIQYVLGVDRGNERVSHLYRPLHPAVIEILGQVVEAATEAGVPLSVCGEMAGDPLCMLPLLGLGVRQLSMGLAAIPLVKQVVARASVSAAEVLAARLRSCATAEETEAEARLALRDLVGSSSPGLVAIPTVGPGRTST